MKRFLVANITNVEMRRLKIFMENSLQCLHSLGYFLKWKTKNEQNSLLEKETIIWFYLRSVYILSLSFRKKEVIQTFTSLAKRKNKSED